LLSLNVSVVTTTLGTRFVKLLKRRSAMYDLLVASVDAFATDT
jgi:hypothetical protein